MSGAANADNGIGERGQPERELQALLRLHQDTPATTPSSLFVLDSKLNIVIADQRDAEGQGIQSPDVVGKNIAEVFPASFLAAGGLLDRIQMVAAGGGRDELVGLKHAYAGPREKCIDIRICGSSPSGGADAATHILLVIDDVTRQRELEAQLRQVVKMASIGRLAGGVAHDFNNFLTGVKGNIYFLLQQTPPDSPMHADLTRIQNLADRAADLTRQLLAFSRREPLETATLDMNALVEDTLGMLRRLIGEDIELEFVAAPDSATVRGDPGQLGQVLMNLVVNARDAIAEAEISAPASSAGAQGGMASVRNPKRTVIETANVTLDEQYAGSHVEVTPGAYVMLAVTDTGPGIDEAIRQRVFEPFFSTKEAGRGTGLGLAVVHDIVKQHEGHIWVYGEPGKGTAFKIHLPRVHRDEQ